MLMLCEANAKSVRQQNKNEMKDCVTAQQCRIQKHTHVYIYVLFINMGRPES